MGKSRRASLNSYRKGPGPKPRRHDPIFKGARRKHKIEQVINLMRDWRLSQFEHEGSALHGLRSGLCLQGYGWERSHQEAVGLVADALRLMGAVRPTWEQGQRSAVIPIENCNRCGVDLDAVQISRGDRFCSTVCAKAAIAWREDEVSRSEDAIGQAAYRLIWRSTRPLLTCQHCGEGFQPTGRGIHQKYCSPMCQQSASRTVMPRACQNPACGKMFRPPKSDDNQRYCSRDCAYVCYDARNGWWTKLYDHECGYCGKSFQSTSPISRWCSQAHQAKAFRAKHKAGGNITFLTPPVFDHVFREAA